MPNHLIGVAPADPVDQQLRGRQQQQDARTGRGIEDRHRGRQSRAEPAAEQDRVRHVADQGDADPDADADAELELPQRLRARGDQERTAEQQQPERIDGARSGAVEQPADQRRHQPAGEPGQRIDRDHLGAVPAEVSAIGLQENRKAFAEAAADHRQREGTGARRAPRVERFFDPLRWTVSVRGMGTLVEMEPVSRCGSNGAARMGLCEVLVPDVARHRRSVVLLRRPGTVANAVSVTIPRLRCGSREGDAPRRARTCNANSAQQDVLLLAHRQLDDAFGREMAGVSDIFSSVTAHR